MCIRQRHDTTTPWYDRENRNARVCIKITLLRYSMYAKMRFRYGYRYAGVRALSGARRRTTNSCEYVIIVGFTRFHAIINPLEGFRSVFTNGSSFVLPFARVVVGNSPTTLYNTAAAADSYTKEAYILPRRNKTFLIRFQVYKNIRLHVSVFRSKRSE